MGIANSITSALDFEALFLIMLLISNVLEDVFSTVVNIVFVLKLETLDLLRVRIYCGIILVLARLLTSIVSTNLTSSLISWSTFSLL